MNERRERSKSPAEITRRSLQTLRGFGALCGKRYDQIDVLK